MKLELTIEETYDFLKFQLKNIKKLQKKIRKAEDKTSDKVELNIGDVSKQRELLIAFLFDFVGGDEQAPIEEWTDSFLDRNKGNL